jgi:hypothetical protein
MFCGDDITFLRSSGDERASGKIVGSSEETA